MVFGSPCLKTSNTPTVCSLTCLNMSNTPMVFGSPCLKMRKTQMVCGLPCLKMSNTQMVCWMGRPMGRPIFPWDAPSGKSSAPGRAAAPDKWLGQEKRDQPLQPSEWGALWGVQGRSSPECSGSGGRSPPGSRGVRGGGAAPRLPPPKFEAVF